MRYYIYLGDCLKLGRGTEVGCQRGAALSAGLPSLLVAGSSPAIMLLKILMQRLCWGGKEADHAPALHMCIHLESEDTSPRYHGSCPISPLHCCQLLPFPVSNTLKRPFPTFAGSLLRLAGITFSCYLRRLLPSVLSRYCTQIYTQKHRKRGFSPPPASVM